MTDQDVFVELDHLRADLEYAAEMKEAAALILEMRATINRLLDELQKVTRERDELRDLRDMGYDLRLKQALAGKEPS